MLPPGVQYKQMCLMNLELLDKIIRVFIFQKHFFQNYPFLDLFDRESLKLEAEILVVLPPCKQYLLPGELAL